MKKLLSILFMIVSVHLFAQDNVISAINITLPTSPDANTANWGTGKSVFVVSATSQMVGGRVNPLLEEGRILVIIKQGGNKVCGAYTSKSAPAADFNTITKVWSGSNAASLLGKDCTLPAGDYELSVQFFGNGPAGTIPLSDEKTKSFTIRGNDQQAYQPPQGIMPADGTSFVEADLKKPITFRWTPLIPKPQDPVTYRLRVWQLMQGQTSAQAIKANQPIITKDVDNLTQAVIANIVDGPCKPPLMCAFVWNVQALTRDGKPIGSNNGTSEAFSFSFASASCGSIVADSTIKCNGIDPKTGFPVYAITINLKNLPTNGLSGCNAKFNNVAINSGGGSISSASSLPITIAPNGTATISFNYTPGTSGATSASVILFGNWADALGNSTNLQVNFGLPKCITCGCSRQWNPLKVQIPGGFKDYDCGSTVVWHCKSPFVFTSSYDCTGSNGKPCDAKISWTVSQSGGGIIQAGTGATGTFTPNANGVYTITLNAECNGQNCAPCTYTIIVRDCIDCDCGKWGQLTVHTLTRPLIYNCGNNIPWNCNKPFNFTSFYACSSSNGKPCTADIKWGVSLNGSVIQSGNGASGNFTPTGNGTYTLTLNVECGDKKCPPCTYTIVVADCCSCGAWGTLNVPQAGGLVMEYKCGSSIPIRMSCNQPFNFTSSYQCSPADKSCQAVTSWEVTEGATVLKTGAGTGSIAGSFTATENGTYTITLYATCGGVKCPACSYKAVVTNCLSCIVPPAGMVGWWPGDNNANDISGYQNNGVLQGGSYVAGKVAQAFSFGSSATYAAVADNPTLNFGTGSFSMDAWIKSTNASNVLNIVDKRTGNVAYPTGYSLYISNGKLAFQLDDGQATLNQGGVGPNVCDGQWHLVAAAIDRTSKTGGKLYVDGVLVFTFDPTTRPGSVTNTGKLLIGQRDIDDVTAFRGQIDEVELFKRVLQPTEISAIYHADSAGKCKTMTNNNKGQQ